MFKKSNFEEELFTSMEANIVKNQMEEKYGLSKLARAIDHLNSAADIFEKAGMIEEAEQTTQVLHSLAMENISISDLTSLNDDDLSNLLEMSSLTQLVKIAKRILKVAKKDSSIKEELLSFLKDFDYSDPGVKEKFISKIKTALKVAKFIV